MQIFGIAEMDTGQSLKINYIHGEGLEVIVADGHKGQGLGTLIITQTFYAARA